MKNLTNQNLVFSSILVVLLLLLKQGSSTDVSSPDENKPRGLSTNPPDEYSRLIGHVISHLTGIHHALASVRLEVRRGSNELNRQLQREIDSMKDAIFTEYTSKNDDRRQNFEARRDDSNYETLVKQVINHITGLNNGMESIRLEVKNYTARLDAERRTELEAVKEEIAGMKAIVDQMNTNMKLNIETIKEAVEASAVQKTKMDQETAQTTSHIFDELVQAKADRISFEEALKSRMVDQNFQIQTLKNITFDVYDEAVSSSNTLQELNNSLIENFKALIKPVKEIESNTKADLLSLHNSVNHSAQELGALAYQMEDQNEKIQSLKNITAEVYEESVSNSGKINELKAAVNASFQEISKPIQEFESNLLTVTTGLNRIQETFNMHTDIFQNIVRSKDCCSIQRSGYVHSGVYAIYPFKNDLSRKVKVYCDLTTDGGGWTVFQRREEIMSPMIDFNRDWAEYEGGFGNLSYSFWLGLPYISALTENRKQSLRVDMTDWENGSKYAEYEIFKVSDVAHLYQLNVSGYSGSAGDSLMTTYSSYNSSGMSFSTKDRDNDRNSENIAMEYKGGWWFNERSHANPNGVYKEREEHNVGENGVFWHDFKNSLFYSIKRMELKIRPEKYANGCH